MKNRRVSLPNLSPLPCPLLATPPSILLFRLGKIPFTRFLLNPDFLYQTNFNVLILNRDFKMRPTKNFYYFYVVNYREGGEKTLLNLLNRRIGRRRNVCWLLESMVSAESKTLSDREGPWGFVILVTTTTTSFLYSERGGTRCRSNTSRPRANTDLRYCGTF